MIFLINVKNLDIQIQRIDKMGSCVSKTNQSKDGSAPNKIVEIGAPRERTMQPEKRDLKHKEAPAANEPGPKKQLMIEILDEEIEPVTAEPPQPAKVASAEGLYNA